VPVVVDHEVVRGDVAVHQAIQLPGLIAKLVRCVGTGTGLRQQVEHRSDRKPGIGTTRGRDQLLERGARHVLHGDERKPSGGPQLEDLHHVGMTDASDDACLAQEHVNEGGLVGEVRQDALHDDQTVEPELAAALGCKEDLCHPAYGEPLDQLVPPDVLGLCLTVSLQRISGLAALDHDPHEPTTRKWRV